MIATPETALHLPWHCYMKNLDKRNLENRVKCTKITDLLKFAHAAVCSE